MADRDGDTSYWAAAMRTGSPDIKAREDARRAHLDRIQQYVRAWHDGQLTLEEKRRAISDENRVFYGGDCPRRLLYPPGA